jgi:uncharacterized membrane protein YccF (DUF307 family)
MDQTSPLAPPLTSPTSPGPALGRADSDLAPAPAMAPSPSLPPQPLWPSAPAQPPAAPPPSPVSQTMHNSVNVNVGGPTIVMVHKNTGPNILVRAVWFWFFGWWLGAFAMIVATAASLTVIGAPLAFWIYNRIPSLATLRPRTEEMNVQTRNGVTYVETTHQTQLPLWQRFVYFVFIGSWLSLIWYSFAVVVGALIVTLPISVLMLDRIGGIATLHKH